MDQGFCSQVRHLYEVERLRVGRKRLFRILRGEALRPRFRERILRPYEHLIEVWYEEYPRLKATRVYERLKEYGYSGCYETVCIGTRRFRKRRKEFYHELDFLPGECYGKKEIMLIWV